MTEQQWKILAHFGEEAHGMEIGSFRPGSSEWNFYINDLLERDNVTKLEIVPVTVEVPQR